jgi:hypothetical protein
VRPLIIKIPSNNLGRQRCAEGFSPGVKWLKLSEPWTWPSEVKVAYTLQAEPNRIDSTWKTNLRCATEAFTLIAEPSRTEPNRTEPDRACSLAGCCFYSPADDRFCCAISLTSRGWSACFFTIYVGLRSFNQCGAFKTGFMGTKWQKLSKQRLLTETVGRSGCWIWLFL